MYITNRKTFQKFMGVLYNTLVMKPISEVYTLGMTKTYKYAF